MVAFAAVEARVAEPLVPLRVVRRRTVAFGNLAGLLAFATETGLVFALTLYLQDDPGVLGARKAGPGVRRPRRGHGAGRDARAARDRARRRPAGGGRWAGSSRRRATLPLVALGYRLARGRGRCWWRCSRAAWPTCVAIVGFMVVATSGRARIASRAWPPGSTSLSQQIGITLGIPVVSAVAMGASPTCSTASRSRSPRSAGCAWSPRWWCCRPRSAVSSGPRSSRRWASGDQISSTATSRRRRRVRNRSERAVEARVGLGRDAGRGRVSRAIPAALNARGREAVARASGRGR